MNYILFDSEARFNLFPLTHTRPIAEIRCGILTMRERWEKLLDAKTSTFTEEYLQGVFPLQKAGDNVLVNACVFATKSLSEAINALNPGEQLVSGETIIAARVANIDFDYTSYKEVFDQLKSIAFSAEINAINNTWDIFSQNDNALRADYQLLTADRKSAAIPEGIIVTGKEHLFIEEGATVNVGCIINANAGPVYIAKDAEILEGTLIRGPLAMCEHSVIKMGAKVYGATTIGPGCKVGGEINNTVFFANSNKAHDGYLGNAVIGEWCNLGADTNCSNLKNNYDEVKVWNEYLGKSVKTGLTFCGLVMGDHSKCAINTAFNTGTVVGVSCNIYGSGFPNQFIPSFCWGGSDGMFTYKLEKAMDTAGRMMARRNKSLSEAELKMYAYVFERTTPQRKLFIK